MNPNIKKKPLTNVPTNKQAEKQEESPHTPNIIGNLILKEDT
jgi:hypothetical protein